MKQPNQKKEDKKQDEWYLNHRRYVTEVICPHGIGHHKGIHGCDSCCKNAPPELWAKTTKDE